MKLKPVMTEKAVMKIETENTLTFFTEPKTTKEEAKKEIESLFEVKVENIRSLVRGSRKHLYVKLNPKNLAIDLATKLGMM